MLSLQRPLLAACLHLLLLLPWSHSRILRYTNGFHYQDLSNGNSNGNSNSNGIGNGKDEIYFNGIRLHVESPQYSVSATTGSNVTLLCHYHYEPELTTPRRTRVRWFWLPAYTNTTSPEAFARESKVMVAMGGRHRSYGNFKGRVRLRRSAPGDMSLVIKKLQLNDTGRYRCEVIDGLEDESVTMKLELTGVVFPYYSHKGRYHFNFFDAQQACQDQDATLATFEQLFAEWEDGLDWCNAGWLSDGTVQYPIRDSRVVCGGKDVAPGVRSYGHRHKILHQYDAFCFTASVKGTVYYLNHPTKLNFTEAVQACASKGSQIAKVGQLYAAWKLMGLDCCKAGWLSDRSVRYPITNPRANCGPLEPGVHCFGFPDPSMKFGVYCYQQMI